MALAIHLSITLNAQETIAFDSDQWQFTNGQIVEHLDRQCLKGGGYLKEMSFSDGIIEIDIAVTGARSYPGINFRVQSPSDYEYFYIRPHRVGLYDDALQYCPSINGITSWQLFSGEGFTKAVDFPKNEWVHFRLAVKGNQAKLYINNAETPALEIFDLQHGESEGTISLVAPANGSAYFSNFKLTKDHVGDFEKAPVFTPAAGMFMDWEISKVYRTIDVEFDKSPQEQGLENLEWEKIRADKTGLVDLSRFRARTSRAPDVVYARTTIHSEEARILEMKFGYSDAIMVFLNQEALFFANSGYKVRDPSFLGIIGLNDVLYLPLKAGDNELMLAVAESFGGWGFMCQDGNAVLLEHGMKEIWSTESEFTTSESVLYNPDQEVLYITNFDQFGMGNPNVSQHISKLSLDGEILDLKWVEGLNNPLGMTLHDDKIYVAERKNVAIIDTRTGEIIERLPVEGSVFLNDIAVDGKGTIYISDSRKNVIWKSNGSVFEAWLTQPEIKDPNVLFMHDNKLLIGNSGDGWLKSVNLDGGNIQKITRFPEGFIDGIRADGKGNLLVSLWRGLIYRVAPDGQTKLIYNTTNKGLYCADFEFIPEKDLLIVPTFFENTVMGYRLSQ